MKSYPRSRCSRRRFRALSRFIEATGSFDVIHRGRMRRRFFAVRFMFFVSFRNLIARCPLVDLRRHENRVSAPARGKAVRQAGRRIRPGPEAQGGRFPSPTLAKILKLAVKGDVKGADTTPATSAPAPSPAVTPRS
jgi:hypothetical protein